MSFRLSPLETLEPLALKLMTSADSRLAAASNEMRVRVESSKKRLTTVRPRSVGSFLTGRSASAGELVGGVEDEGGVVEGQVAGGQQVTGHQAAPPDWDAGGESSSAPPITTASRPSVSATSTCTFSRVEVGRFLPT